MVSCQGHLENTIDDTLNLGFRVSSDKESVTRFPEFRITESNQVFVDLPGFVDTRGVNSDLVNAAFIKSLVERARVIKALVVLNAVQSERGQGTVQVLRATKLLGEELRDSSLLALVNKVSTDDYDAGEDFIDEFVVGEGAEFAYLRKLREASRLSLVPKLRRTETFVDFTAKWKDSVLEKIAGIRGTHVETALIEWTLNAKSIGLIEKYFRYTFLDVLYKEMMNSWGKIASSVDHRSKDFESKRDDVKSSFHKRLEEDDRFCMIRDLVKGIYSDIETEQQVTFNGKFALYIQYLKIQEEAEQVRIAKEQERIAKEQTRTEKRKTEEAVERITNAEKQLADTKAKYKDMKESSSIAKFVGAVIGGLGSAAAIAYTGGLAAPVVLSTMTLTGSTSALTTTTALVTTGAIAGATTGDIVDKME
jgi:hypothetical protein